jgi:translation initiation factor IF-2
VAKDVEGRTVKVFEFAKEIGMETLQLMDKIREWKLPVRSHMADLNSDMLEEIRTKLSSDSTADTGAKKATKKAAKKSADSSDEDGATASGSKAAGKTTAKSAGAKSSPQKAAGTATKKVSARGAKSGKSEIQGPANASPGKKAAAVVVKKAAAKVVVRRKADEEAAEAEAAAQAEAEAAEIAAQAAEEAQAEAEQAAIEAAQAEVAIETAAQDVDESVNEASVNEVPAALVSPARGADVFETPNEISAAGPAAIGAKDNTPARKREVVMTASGPSSGIRSEPRRNIVGRMDLSRVQAPQGGPRPGGPIGSGPRPGGFTPGGPRGPGIGGGIGGTGPRPLRTGFVSAPSLTGAPVNPFDDAFDKKKFEVKREKKVGVGAGTGKEEPIATFSSTEFRKREMVFQPKKKKGMLNRVGLQTQKTVPKASKRIVKVNQTMKVSDLAQEMGIKAAQITKALMTQGVMATMATDLDFDTIALIVPEFGFEAQNVFKTVDEVIESTVFGNLDTVRSVRAPVVTIMGHVDHGKTSLLDAIRKAKVAEGEAGGITQHIGAYQVSTDSGQKITFIDTPGHEAFTAMRARGANITDIVVIVVAADDGVMPQTAEAINHAKAAGVPIIVAVNKMDKQGANPDKVKQQMTEFELVPEEWGGQTIYAPVSALKKTGLTELLEHIALTAEVEELDANPERSATGVVIESRMDKGRGPVATLLVQDGTLKVGQSIVVGSVAGRVRALINDQGKSVKEAGPSMPVEILGLSAVPGAGDRFDVAQSDDDAARIAELRREKVVDGTQGTKVSMEAIFDKLKAGAVKELPIVLKSDVAGSAEAIKGMFEKIATSEVKLKLIHSAVGGINASDVLLASSAEGMVIGFNVRPDGGAQSEAKRLGVEIKTYSIVYELMDDMKKALSGMLTPETRETQNGRAEVRNIFTVPKAGTIAGCFVVDGKIMRNSQVRLIRDGKIVYTGKLGSLKRFKDDAKEVAQGYECGLSIENYNDLKVGDVVEAFSQESIAREL